MDRTRVLLRDLFTCNAAAVCWVIIARLAKYNSFQPDDSDLGLEFIHISNQPLNEGGTAKAKIVIHDGNVLGLRVCCHLPSGPAEEIRRTFYIPSDLRSMNWVARVIPEENVGFHGLSSDARQNSYDVLRSPITKQYEC